MATFEEEIDKRLPYRFGSRKLPMLPVDVVPIYAEGYLKYCPDFSLYERNIKTILKEHEFEPNSVAFQYRFNSVTEPTEEHITLAVFAFYSDEAREHWSNAFEEIQSYLRASGFPWVIEMIDPRVDGHRALVTSPILSTDCDLIEAWNKARPGFLDTMKDRDWVAIDVLHRQFPSREEFVPTVIISARDANDDAWDSILPKLRQFALSSKLEADIVILFTKGIDLTVEKNDVSSSNRLAHDNSIQSESPEKLLPIGASCSTPYSKSTGTLGGGLLLQKDESVFQVGLTNYHVLWDAVSEHRLSAGPFPPNPQQPYNVAVSPSHGDHNNSIESIRDELRLWEDVYDQRSNELDLLDKSDPGWQGLNHRVGRLSQKRETLKNELGSALATSCQVGNVYSASGFRTCHNERYNGEESKDWALDWCLVQVNPPYSTTNALSSVPSDANYLQVKKKLTNYCSMSPNENYLVMKRGRTSGWTQGIISSISSIVRLDETCNIPSNVPTNQRVVFEEKWHQKPVFVHSIIGTGKSRQFIHPGDSGSLVLLDQAVANNEGASIVGLGFASNESACASYMMPIDLVFKDIEKITEAKVIKPTYAGTVAGIVKQHHEVRLGLPNYNPPMVNKLC